MECLFHSFSSPFQWYISILQDIALLSEFSEQKSDGNFPISMPLKAAGGIQQTRNSGALVGLMTELMLNLRISSKKRKTRGLTFAFVENLTQGDPYSVCPVMIERVGFGQQESRRPNRNPFYSACRLERQGASAKESLLMLNSILL